MSAFAAALAAVAVRRPALLVAAALLVLAASFGVLRSHQAFDSEILNLLPAGTPSVEGLKIYNSRFTSARELAFLVTGAEADHASSRFVEELRKQPWVLRVMDGPPTASAEGRATLPALVAPLILAQSASDFDATLARLDAEAIRARIQRLAAAMAAGSPLARIELESDPLGIIAPVAGRLADKLAVAETFDLQAGNVRLIPVITTQTDLSAEACRTLMADVHEFIEAFARQSGSDAPDVAVTGRAAYVDEISSSMQRDITTTTIVSLLAVTLLFWFSFRSLLPLAGSVLILAFSCIVSLAAGSLFFDKLNVVAMGFCSILIGLGDDFSLLLYQRYLIARQEGRDREAAIAESTRHSAPGILWVALTTSLGFATLILSGSAGFGQLGILISTGVLIGAAGMIFLMPLCERGNPAPPASDPVRRLCDRFLSRGVFRAAAGLLALAFLLAILPWRLLRFDTSPQSLEPRDIPASKALAAIMASFPETFEPVMVVLPGPVAQDELRTLDTALEGLRSSGLIAGFSSPSPLVADPAAVERNLGRLRQADGPALEAAVRGAEAEASLREGSLQPAVDLLRLLRPGSPAGAVLPPSSPWWFVLDRVVSPGSGDVIFYIRLPSDTSAEKRREVERAVNHVAPRALVTGWSQMLHDLVPWATRELLFFGSLVVAIILAILLATYRSLSFLGLHALTLALALAGTVATLKLAGQAINLLNVLAFPLILAVGVDYGVHLLHAVREPGDVRQKLPAVMKPVLISGLTTITGFGALTLAKNPALNGLGLVCATGVAWCLFASLCFLAPIACRRGAVFQKPR